MNFDRLKKGIYSVISLLFGIALIILSFIFRNEWDKWLITLLNIIGTICLFVGLCFGYLFVLHNKKIKALTVKEMSMIAVQSAITVVLYLFVKFNLPFFPGFLDIHVSEIPALITSYMYGPYVGFIVILIRFIIKLPMTLTAGVGELADLIIGASLVIVSGLIYQKKRTMKGAFISLGVGILSSTLVACLVNWLILIPAYIYIANFPLSTIVGMCSMIPGINEHNFMLMYIFIGALPFNLFRFVIVFILTFILYKKTHTFIKRIVSK